MPGSLLSGFPDWILWLLLTLACAVYGAQAPYEQDGRSVPPLFRRQCRRRRGQ